RVGGAGPEVDAVDRRDAVALDDSRSLGGALRSYRVDEDAKRVALASWRPKLQSKCRAVCHYRIHSVKNPVAQPRITTHPAAKDAAFNAAVGVIGAGRIGLGSGHLGVPRCRN